MQTMTANIQCLIVDYLAGFGFSYFLMFDSISMALAQALKLRLFGIKTTESLVQFLRKLQSRRSGINQIKSERDGFPMFVLKCATNLSFILLQISQMS